MPAPLSQMVLKRDGSAAKVVASARTHRDALVAGLEKRFAPRLKPGQILPDFGTVIDLCAADIDGTREDMGLADRAHHDELSDDPPMRDLRDAESAGLNTSMTDTREGIRGAFGPAAEKAAGFEGRLPETPRGMAKLALVVADRLLTLKDKHALRRGMQFDPAPIADDLRTRANALLAALGHVDEEARQAEDTLHHKTTRIAVYDDSFSGNAAVFAGLCRLADRKDLGDRLMPSERRPGVTVEDDRTTPEE